MNPLLSVIVPTKNRYKYLKHLIDLIDSFNSNDIELVIQDNSDNNQEILLFLDNKSYPNVRYFYTTDKLSMSRNSDAAILNSTGEYVCFIGDDDGVCRNIIDCAKWMKKSDIDAVKPSKVGYYWGDYNKEKLKDNLSQTLVFKKIKYSFQFVEPLKELETTLKIGFQDKRNLPFLYNGIVKRSVLNEIYSIGKTYFPGGSPDISNGVSLCFYIKKYAVINIPVVIPGTSYMTGGGIHKREGKISNLEDVGFIDQSVIDNWEKKIPKIWAGKFAWPESALKGLKYVGYFEYLEKMNYDYMFANFSIYHYPYRKLAWEYTPNKIKYISYVFWILSYNICRVTKNKIVALFCNKTNGLIRVGNMQTIIDAEKYLMNKCDNNLFFK